MNNKGIGIVLVLLIVAATTMGCIEGDGKSDYVTTTTGQEARLTEENQNRLLTASPPPKLDKSLERENLIRRLDLLNDENKIFYIYLVSYGKVMAEYVAKGKVSSVNSKLTTQEQIVESPYFDNINGAGGNAGLVVESPDLDGSYGTNGAAIFFFTADGAYVEWAGEYMLSDFPLQMTTPPELVRQIE
ncbi:MAG: hypothetical protein U9Q37_02830 [Euryarchaeota archaeon]|nr:hypothetical protein [Euryarchaeota archaeon]